MSVAYCLPIFVKKIQVIDLLVINLVIRPFVTQGSLNMSEEGITIVFSCVSEFMMSLRFL